MLGLPPEIARLTDAEARMLAVAIADVARFYPVNAGEKAMAWSGLGMAALAIYGTRVAMIAQIRKRAQNTGATAPATPDAPMNFGGIDLSKDIVQ